MTGKIKLVHSGGNSVSVAVPTNAPSASEVEFKLPQADGSSGQALVTDASGNLSFAGTGKILQVVSTTKTDVFSESLAFNTLSADAMSLSITPSSASNKILISINSFIGCSSSVRTNATIYKAGSVLTGSIGDADGSKNRTSFQASNANTARGNTAGGTYLDTAGSTSAITYSIRLSHGGNSTQTIYLNRVHSEADSGAYFRNASTITLTEVAA